MKVLVSDILAKIPSLPPNVRDLVTIHSDDLSLADVKSRTSDAVHTVHIEPHVDDPGDKSILNTTCPCDARKLCWHVVAFYAVSKGLAPEKPSDPQQQPDAVGPAQVAAERDTDELDRKTMELINAFGTWAHEIASRVK